MESFDQAFLNTMKHEGGYSNRASDLGGETFRGISRRWWGGWEGWDIIDGYEDGGRKIVGVNSSVELEHMAVRFYKENYWDRARCEQMPRAVAGVIFDYAVNSDVPDAVLSMQEGLNRLNRNETVYKDIVEDGRIGRKTFTALSACVADGRERVLCVDILMRRVMKFNEVIDEHPEQEINYLGWIRRIAEQLKAVV